jgi:hypothetical protein
MIFIQFCIDATITTAASAGLLFYVKFNIFTWCTRFSETRLWEPSYNGIIFASYVEEMSRSAIGHVSVRKCVCCGPRIWLTRRIMIAGTALAGKTSWKTHTVKDWEDRRMILRRILGTWLWGWKVDVTGEGQCSAEGFGVSGGEPSAWKAWHSERE